MQHFKFYFEENSSNLKITNYKRKFKSNLNTRNFKRKILTPEKTFAIKYQNLNECKKHHQNINF